MIKFKKGVSRAFTAALLSFCLAFSMLGTAFAASVEDIQLDPQKVAEAKAELIAAAVEAAEDVAAYYAENSDEYLAAAAEGLVAAKPYVETALAWAATAEMSDQLRAELIAELELTKATIAELEVLVASGKLAELDAEALAAAAALLPTVNAHMTNIIEIFVLADQYGLPADLQAQIDALKAQLEDLKVQAENDPIVLAKIAEIEALIAELEAQLAELEACVKAEIEALAAEIEAQIAAIEKAIAELEAQVDYQIAVLKETVANIKAEVEKAIAEAKVIAEQAYADFIALLAVLADQVEFQLEELKAAAEYNALTATHGGVVFTEDLNVLAIGDANASGSNLGRGEANYTELVAEALGVEAVDMTFDGMRAEDLRYILDESYELDAYGKEVVFAGIEDIPAVRYDAATLIEAADLITLSIGSESLSTFAVNQLLAPVELDWARYVGGDNVAAVKLAIDELVAYLVSEGLEAEIAGYVASLVEAYAYGYLGFCFNYTQAIDGIQAINPDAEIVVVGLYNGFDNLVIEGVAVAEYIEYFVDLVDAQFFVYAAANADDVTFVSVRDAATDADGIADLGADFVKAVLDGKALRANAEGHAYIAEQILGALAVATVADEVVYDVWGAFPEISMVTGLGEDLGWGLGTEDALEVGTINALLEADGFGWETEISYEITHLATVESFKDFEAGAWYLEEGQGSFAGLRTLFMDYTLATGIMSGYVNADGTITNFGPWDSLDRAQAATIIYRMSGNECGDTTDPELYADNGTTMADVEDGKYYTAAVNWCVENGIITGYQAGPNAGKFKPYNKVTRSELAAMIQRYCVEVCGVEMIEADVMGYEDSDLIDTTWALPGLQFCKAYGIMTGIHGKNELNPVGKANRAEASKMFAVVGHDILW